MPFHLSDFFWALLKLIFEFSIFGAVVSAMWKYFTDRRLKALEGKFGEQLARLSSKLDRQKEGAVHVFKAKFDLEVKVYQEIWTSLWQLRDNTFQMQPKLDSHPMHETDEEKKKRLWERYKRHITSHNESVQSILKSQPFYPKEIHDKIWEFVRACSIEGIRFESGIEFNERGDYKERDRIVAEIEKAYFESCEVIRKRIDSLSVIEDDRP